MSSGMAGGRAEQWYGCTPQHPSPQACSFPTWCNIFDHKLLNVQTPITSHSVDQSSHFHSKDSLPLHRWPRQQC